MLAEGARRVVAVERDERCLPALAEIAAAYPGQTRSRLRRRAEDRRTRTDSTAERVRIAANLPYNIGTALLVKWLTAPALAAVLGKPDLMFQREVAERIVAKPDTEAYGRLSVLPQWRTTPKILFDVSRSAFVPPPKVTSSVVRLEPLAEPVAPARSGRSGEA